MTQVDLSQYQSFWHKREQQTMPPTMKKLSQQARIEAKRLSQILVDEFGVTAVYLFGSFAWGPEITPNSDLDLAVIGLPSGQLIQAHTRISNISSYSLDLISFEKLSATLQNRIRQSGIQLQ